MQISIASVVDTALHYISNSNDKGYDLRKEIYARRGNQEPEDLAKAVIKEIIASAAIWSATIASVVDFFLDAARTEEHADFLKLSDDEKALGYIHEAIRFNPPFTAMLRRANHATTVGSLQVTQGTDILLSLFDANADVRASCSLIALIPSYRNFRRGLEMRTHSTHFGRPPYLTCAAAVSCPPSSSTR
jgi:linoleate 10R-lipoxygenase